MKAFEVGSCSLIKSLLLTMSLVFLSGCGYKPVKIYNNSIYIGLFIGAEQRETGCRYSYVQGTGIQLGLWTFGLGYFEKKHMEVDKEVSKHCESKIAEVFVVDNDSEGHSVKFK